VGPPSPDNSDPNALVLNFSALVGNEFELPGTGYAATPTAWGATPQAVTLETAFADGTAPAGTFTAALGSANYFVGQVIFDQACASEGGVADSGKDSASEGGGGSSTDAGQPIYVGGAGTETGTDSATQHLSYANHAGDFEALVLYCGQGGFGITSVVDSQHNVWNLGVSGLYGNPDPPGFCNAIYWANNVVGGADTITITYGEKDIYGTIMAVEFKNVASGNPVVGSATSSAYVYPINSGPMSVGASFPGGFVLGGFTDDAAGDTGNDNGFTLLQNVSNNSTTKVEFIGAGAGTYAAISDANTTTQGLNAMGIIVAAP
jgi:hypothetical protein